MKINLIFIPNSNNLFRAWQEQCSFRKIPPIRVTHTAILATARAWETSNISHQTTASKYCRTRTRKSMNTRCSASIRFNSLIWSQNGRTSRQRKKAWPAVSPRSTGGNKACLSALWYPRHWETRWVKSQGYWDNTPLVAWTRRNTNPPSTSVFETTQSTNAR